jgi:hypothetical protein
MGITLSSVDGSGDYVRTALITAYKTCREAFFGVADMSKTYNRLAQEHYDLAAAYARTHHHTQDPTPPFLLPEIRIPKQIP